MSVKLVAAIRAVETRELEATGDDYAAARAAIDAQLPSGWQVLSYRTASD